MAEEKDAVKEVKKAAKDAKVRSRRRIRPREERHTIESGQAVHSVTLNPDDMEEVQHDLVAGVDNDDEGDLEFHPEHFEGVSPDRLLKASTSHGYPVVTDEEIEEHEKRQKELDEHNKAREAEREEMHKANEERARKRLRDMLGS